MSFLDSLFKDRKSQPSVCHLEAEPISIETLTELIPVRNFSQDKLRAFATEAKSDVYPEQTVLFRSGEQADCVMYLLKGSVILSDNGGQTYEIKAGTTQAKFPLSSGALHTTTAVANSDTAVLRVSHHILAGKHADKSKFMELEIPDELAENRLLQAFVHHYNSEEMEIPSLPDVAVKLRHAMQHDIGAADAVKIIQLDPVISAKLVEVANCPLYVCEVPAKSCLTAVSRIGLHATRSLVISLSIHHIFKTNSPLIKKYLDKIWRQSLYTSTLSYVLASVTKQANPEEALLAGLVSDIGAVPFLNFTANLPKDYYSAADIDLVLPYVKGPIGARILHDWEFSEDIVKIPLFSEDWYQSQGPELDLTDIVVLSRLHSKIGRHESGDLPAITSIPAASKLKDYSLSPEQSLKILHEAKQQISDALLVLGS